MYEVAGERCHIVNTGPRVHVPVWLSFPLNPVAGPAGPLGVGQGGGAEGKLAETLQGWAAESTWLALLCLRGPWSLSRRKPHGQLQDLLKLGDSPCLATTTQVGWVAHRSLRVQTPQDRPGRRGQGK